MTPTTDTITVRHPHTLPAAGLPVERIPLGAPGDYKPMAVQRPDGELLLTAFRGHELEKKMPSGRAYMHEDVLFFRSADDGRSWSDPDVAADVLPREPYLCPLSDGTLLLTMHLHPRDHRNPVGHVQSYVYRSVDGGRTWLARPLVPDEYRPGLWIHSSRNSLELQDKSVILGISSIKDQPDIIYRSHDQGLTWTHEPVTVHGKPPEYTDPLWAEAFFWQNRAGRVLALCRVNQKQWPIEGKSLPEKVHYDQAERLVVLRSDDYGHSWQVHENMGGYGTMYPSILHLQDGRLLLTYTVRSLDLPLGVRAIVGKETEDGFSFSFDHDIIIIDGKTPEGNLSGGGFGNTLQLNDGTLLTPYSYRNADNPEAAGTQSVQMEIARWQLP